MNQTFILQNQHQRFLGKNKEWLDGYDVNGLFKTLHKDEAINQMVEVSAKDYQQRVKIIACDLDEKGLPIIQLDLMASPIPKAPKPSKVSSAATDELFAASLIESAEEEADVELILNEEVTVEEDTQKPSI